MVVSKAKTFLKKFYETDEPDEETPLLDNSVDKAVSTLKTAAQTTAFIEAMKHYTTFGPPSIAPADLRPPVDPSIFNRDSKGIIDFVLAYQPTVSHEEENGPTPEPKNRDKFGGKFLPSRSNYTIKAVHNAYRQVFERKLKEEGLIIEKEGLEQSQDGKTCFLKVHAPWDVLAAAAEINRVKMPIKHSDISDERDRYVGKESEKYFERLCPFVKNPMKLEEWCRPPVEPTFFSMEFDKSRFGQYIGRDRNTFFPQTVRLRLVWDILQQATVKSSEIIGQRLKGHHEGEGVGLNYMLKEKVYVAAYPLHDGDEYVDPQDKSKKPDSIWPLRVWLHETWARPGRWMCYQPLDQIRSYFGEKIGLYFAWLGFYTTMLIPLAILGMITFIYGLLSFSEDIPMIDVCYSNFSGTIICRSCKSMSCEYESLDDYCLYAVVNAIFDNISTFPFAFLTSMWAILFLELWKRYEARLSCKWDTVDVQHEYEPPRPEYQANAKERRRHPVTREWEPYISNYEKTIKRSRSFCGVAFFMCVVLAVITSIIIYKILMVKFYSNLHSDFIDALGSSTFTSITASIISSICMIILEKLYGSVAWKLTERELPRTMTDFETSFIYKMYIFQFVNYYATLFYLAFIQGNMAGTPITNTILTDYCSPVGCMFSVTTQLCVILIVKQILQNCLEVVIPYVKTYLRRRRNVEESAENVYTRYEKDFDLQPSPQLPLMSEYLEMVLQYGFVTMFGAAFPPAALLAFMNNVAEIRIDAYKFVIQNRRAIPHRSDDIGNWYGILEFVTRLAILTNAVFIAFTTDIIDRMVYLSAFSTDGTLNKYLDFTLAMFDTHDWYDQKLLFQEEFGEVTHCRYKGYYTPPENYYKYSYSKPWWIIMLLKVAFVPIFQNVVLFIQGLIQYVIPDVPDDVNLHIQRNRYVSMEAAHKRDRERRKRSLELSGRMYSYDRDKELPVRLPSVLEHETSARRRPGANSAPVSPASPLSSLTSEDDWQNGQDTREERGKPKGTTGQLIDLWENRV